jgi:hypothetical protein
MVTRKSARNYTSAARDLQEASLHHMQTAAEVYDQLSGEPRWATIQCFDSLRDAMRPPDEIATEILAVVEPLLTPPALPGAR